MRFVVASEQYLPQWSVPGEIHVGDRYLAISKKIREEHFLGFTYTTCTVLQILSSPSSKDDRSYRVLVGSEKRIDFQEKGVLFSIGMSEQVVQVSETGEILSLHVIRSESTLIGGSGEMKRYQHGTYRLKPLHNHMFDAVLEKPIPIQSSSSSSSSSTLSIVSIPFAILLLGCLFLFFFIFFLRK